MLFTSMGPNLHLKKVYLSIKKDLLVKILHKNKDINRLKVLNYIHFGKFKYNY